MYTQCPECDVAFRVTAKVLKQAAGKVRCGGCGIAFNALEHLSEEIPEAAVRSDPEPILPELIPEEPGRLEAGTRPKKISAEQSAALLKTLDQLAGEDIQIEDTGSEWRVIGDDDDDDDEMRFDDNTPLAEDGEPEPVPAPKSKDDKADSPTDAEEEQVDLDIGDPDEWEDLLADIDEPEVFDSEMLHSDIPPDELSRVGILDTEKDAEEKTDVSADLDSPPDMDTQFAIQAEAMGIDLSGVNEADDETTIDEDLISAAFETEAVKAKLLKKSEEPEEPEESEEPEEAEEAEEPEKLEELQGVEGLEELKDFDLDFNHPEQTAEEQALNIMIDEDLYAIAVEDEDGMRSTVSLKSEQIVEASTEPKEEKSANPLMETIVMEGESLQDDVYKPAKPAGLGDPGFGIQKQKASDMRLSGRRRRTGPKSYGTIAVAILLAVILAFQVIHNSREALATAPVFEKTIASVYRMVGSPVTPAWDIKGWRFEATKGSTDEADRLLTIYSRVGNKSQQALPYPLIHVSLTDRYEEIIGSRVLEPTEYLVNNADPRVTIQPGDTFDAVIAIESPSAEATGFKLNVCYRMDNWQLKCAIADFR
jgi:predicted Zn finger-like uncharacterized protein